MSETSPTAVVLAIDPGRDKCGVAVVAATGIGTEYKVLERRIIAPPEMQKALLLLVEQYSVRQIVIGHATASQPLQASLSTWVPAVAVVVVDETGSTLEARDLYWQTHPARGWRRVLPLSLQVPPQPIDDFAAVVLAQRYLEQALG